MAAATGPSAPRASERLLVRALQRRGPMTRRALALETGLPLSTVTGAATRLLARGLVHVQADEAGSHRRSPGRPMSLLALAEPATLVAAFVIYGDELRAACVTSTGQIVVEARRPCPQWWQADMVAQAKTLLDGAISQLPPGSTVDRLVAGVPFPYRQGIGYRPLQADQPHADAWMFDDLAAALAEATRLPTFVDNSCRLTTLAEHAFGAAQGHDNVVYLQLVGGGSNAGVIAEGNLIRGAIGLAGEISHLHVDADGPFCPCGARGCLGITIEQPDLLIEAIHPTYPDVNDIHQLLGLAAQGAPGLRSLLRELGELVGRHLAAGCIMLNPEIIVVDGALGPAVAPVITGLRDALSRVLPDTVFASLDIVAGKFGPEGALLGAAAVSLTNELAHHGPQHRWSHAAPRGRAGR